MIDTKALRNRILDLAIQGKLTEQLESDGTAEELYQQIQAEKQALIKEGKIKKEKPLPEISADEIPFEIPQNWMWVRLGEIVTLLGDGIHGTPKYDENGEYYFINGNNLCNGVIEIKTNTKRIDYDEFLKYKKELNDNTVLVSINGTLGNLAFYNNEKVILGKSACYFNLVKKEMKVYIYYLLKTDYFLKYANYTATGVTIRNVSLKAMNEFLVPLPPLTEQKRIVERVEEIFRLLDTIDKAQEKYSADSQILKAKLITAGIRGKLTKQLESDGTAHELYQQIQEEKQKLIKEGKIKKEKPLPPISPDEIPFEIPQNWMWVRFSEVYELSNGIASRGSEGGIERPVLRLADIKDNCLNIDNIRGILLTDNEYNTHIIRKNDLVIIRVNGSKERVAMSFPYEYDTDISYCDHLFCARKKSDLVCSEYFAIAINTKAIREQIVPMIKTTAGQNTISQGSLNSILLPLPPLAEQKRIADVLERVLGVVE